jgi:hypothetical protein
LKTVITQLRKDGFSPFCLFGHSRGANDVLIYSSKFTTASKSIESCESTTSIVDEVENKGDSRESAVKTGFRPMTPTTIATISSSSQLSEVTEKINTFSFEKGDIISQTEVEKEVEILKESATLSDTSHLLDAEKLMIVVAAPRFNMPTMLTTLFTSEQIALLEDENLGSKFPWSSGEKGEKCCMKNKTINFFLNSVFYLCYFSDLIILQYEIHEKQMLE